jgi:c-di-GMP-binding flagellar brake protein YcgR
MNYTATEAASASGQSQRQSSNRRSYERVPMRTTVILTTPNGRHVHARMFDIARGGVGVVVDDTLPVGTELRMQFRIPVGPINGTQMIMSATIMNVVLAASKGGFRMGLRFVHLTSEANDAIESFLTKEAARQRAALPPLAF